MNTTKIIRSLCYFSHALHPDLEDRLATLSGQLGDAGYAIQTRRLCFLGQRIIDLDAAFPDPDLYVSAGGLDRKNASRQFDDFIRAKNTAFHRPLTNVRDEDISLLFDIIRTRPEKTFSFTYTFCNAPSSPYFPSAHFEKEGFALGLQPTDSAAGCDTLEEWLLRMMTVWSELAYLFRDRHDFLGIDSSIAPLFTGDSSLIHHIRRWCGSFSRSVTLPVYLKITEFIRTRNPRPVGLCGIMFPCLEDFELAEEYEAGRFSVERNIYLSLHSGLGIDTYPVGVDESPETVRNILEILSRLAHKYQKPLSARFVSDGKARIGDKTNFGNPYLKDVTVRGLQE
ncbi:MAG TPA: DUF711 family protein [bacterium]|nr:DUF711 family protein [bacterium]